MPVVTQRPKFTFIQALRGLAALWVVLFHLEKTDAIAGLTAQLPDWMTLSVFRYGNAGVALFFVLSGFVIAHSLTGKVMTGKEWGRFVARRSVRLDPPYWVSIVLVVGVESALAFAHETPLEVPSSGQVVAHMLYLQELFNVPEIQIVYWTLTYEIQFYLIFAASLWAGQRWNISKFVEYFLFGLALWSAFQASEWAQHGLFLNRWHGFMLGVMAYRAGVRRDSICPFAILIATTAYGASTTLDVFGNPCVGAAILLFFAARANWLTGGFRARPWQMLGAISYSLYLVHLPIIRLPMGVWQSVLGRGFWSDTGFGIAALSACIVSATLLYLFIEKPSHGLAQSLFREQNEVSSQLVDNSTTTNKTKR